VAVVVDSVAENAVIAFGTLEFDREAADARVQGVLHPKALAE